jgi:hypothetical protein
VSGTAEVTALPFKISGPIRSERIATVFVLGNIAFDVELFDRKSMSDVNRTAAEDHRFTLLQSDLVGNIGKTLGDDIDYASAGAAFTESHHGDGKKEKCGKEDPNLQINNSGLGCG